MNNKPIRLRSASASEQIPQWIKEAMGALKPWWDDIATREMATMCMLQASLAGHLLASQKVGAKAEGMAMLQHLSEASNIPLSVLSTYAEGAAALANFAKRQRSTGTAGGKNHE